MYVDDVVEALLSASTAADVDRRIINVGSGRETSVSDLVALVEKATRHNVEVIHSPAESGGVSRMRADISIARKLLNFEPRVELDDGLRHTLKQDPRFQR